MRGGQPVDLCDCVLHHSVMSSWSSPNGSSSGDMRFLSNDRVSSGVMPRSLPDADGHQSSAFRWTGMRGASLSAFADELSQPQRRIDHAKALHKVATGNGDTLFPQNAQDQVLVQVLLG
jgi:hypothetical protein